LKSPFEAPGGPPGEGGPGTPGSDLPLAKHLCRVTGLNQNYTSSVGTLYHIQVEDRGPVLDPVLEIEVRRVNTIIYANYGEPNARIIFGRDHDFPDARTAEQNRQIELQIKILAEGARRIIDEKEQRQVLQIKCLIREYYLTKDDAAKKEFEQANALYPFLFSRAWAELKQEQERARTGGLPEPLPAPAPPPAALTAPAEEVVYPLDPVLRERVLEIERVLEELTRDLELLKGSGRADDILLQTCRKLMTRAKETLAGREPTDFTTRRLEMTRNSLTTTWKQVRSRLKAT
jgi:hypothetical protein